MLEHYPDLFFLLNYTEIKPSPIVLHSETGNVSVDGIDILYVYGIGLGEHYLTYQVWLHEKRERRLIFLEDELYFIDQALKNPEVSPLFTDPQVVVQFFEPKQLSLKLDELIAAFPSDRIDVTAIKAYQKHKKRRFLQIRLHLLRGSTVAHSLLTETLYAHKLLGNVLRNIKRWDGSFFAGGLKGKFVNVPAIICGAGPSLQNNIELLKTLDDRALIIAGGSTIAALSNQGVHPHLGVALDPNAEEFDRLKIASAYEMPLIYATRLQPDVFNAISGEWGYLVTDTGGSCERYFEAHLGFDLKPIGPELGAEAMSVTTLAIAMAVEMGCNPIFLNGIDLAYTNMQRYAEGIMPSSRVHLQDMRAQTKASERLLKRKNIHGHYVHTLVKWVMESECIGAFAKSQNGTQFYNVAEGGLGFPGIANASLSDLLETLPDPTDLRALVHAEIQRLKMPPMKEKIAEEMQSICESLERLEQLTEEMLSELERARKTNADLPTGKMAILEIDFQEEKAFECLFPHLGPALDKLLARAFFLPCNCSNEEKKRLQIDAKIAKFQHFKKTIESELALFQAEITSMAALREANVGL